MNIDNLFSLMDVNQEKSSESLPKRQVTLKVIKICPHFNYSNYRTKFTCLNWEKIESYFKVSDRVIGFTSELLQKYLLPELVGCEPFMLKLAYSNEMRPFIKSPDVISAAYDFNVSHSRDYVVMALYSGSNYKIGVDIEFIDQSLNISELQGIVFSISEQELIAKSHLNFYKLWTKKEALIKAIGYGFSNDFFQTTRLTLDNVEITHNYILLTQQFADYFISYCLYKIPA